MVTPAESRNAGVDIGEEFGEFAAEALIKDPKEFVGNVYEDNPLWDILFGEAFDAEINAHQMADWVNGIGYEMTHNCGTTLPLDFDEGCYEAYEEGVADGIEKGIKKTINVWLRRH
tara:strand:- start:512 stop:859 length:348 start_codon:yes stop_codon:yes gene_type:complete